MRRLAPGERCLMAPTPYCIVPADAFLVQLSPEEFDSDPVELLRTFGLGV